MADTILLINFPTKGRYRPSGLEYVAEATRNAGYSVELLDLGIKDDAGPLLRAALDGRKYSVIGISIFNTQWDSGRDEVKDFIPDVQLMIEHIRRLSSAVVVLGGFGFSFQPEGILEYTRADYGVAGPGIPAFVNLLKTIGSGSLKKGTVVRDDEIAEYLDYPFQRNMVDPARYSKDEEVFVSTKIGCFENCFHCWVGGTRFRLRKPQHVVAEVRHLADQGFRNISFINDVLNVPVQHLKAICEGIAGLGISWNSYVLPVKKYLPDDLVSLMKHSGMVSAGIGTRMACSQKMMKMYGTGFDKEDLEFATDLFRSKDIRANWFVGFGGPGETRETIDEAFAFVDMVSPDGVNVISRIRIYKGTPLARMSQKEGIIGPEDPLLAPVYYPFSDELRDYIYRQVSLRKNCHFLY